MSFNGKVALITGAASGMGMLTAKKLVASGAQVVMLDINEEAVLQVAADVGGIPRVCDVRSYQQVAAAVEFTHTALGRVDITISYAGGAASRVCREFKDFNDLSPEAIEWGIDVNFKAPIYMARAVFNLMAAQKQGVIVNIGSIDGITGSRAAEYSASKAGLLGLTKSLAIMGAPYGVRSVCVSPGPVLTREAMKNMKTLLGRAAAPEEVVDLVRYLCSDKAAFITGENITIDGGRACGAGIL